MKAPYRRRNSSPFRPLRLEWLERRDQPDAALGALLVHQRASVTLAGDPFAAVAAADRPVPVPTGIPGLVRVSGTAEQLERWAGLYRDDPFVSYTELEQRLSVGAVPNDPRYADGTTWGLSGAFGIAAPAAWDVTTGSTRVVVADIDSGIDYNHPDLYLNVWVNQAEIPSDRKARLLDTDGDGLFTFWDLNDARNQGTGKITDLNADGRIDGGDLLAPWRADGTGGWADGVSQDGDAYVDDLIGWNFVNNTNNPMDDHGHGTHTGGTILAVGNDGRGVAGVNWKGQLMGLKFLASNGSGSSLGAAQAVRYAADHGARVSNNSYGGGGGTTLSDAIQYAGGRGHVFVAAAGNSGQNTDATPSYPAAYNLANIISVAATDSSGNLAGFSNYGATTVDVGAPGVNVYSTVPGGYGYASGTSMAAPHVTGVATLLVAANPGWTYTQVVSRILQTTTPDAALAGRTVSGGIVNAARAVGTPPAAGLQGGGFESPSVGTGTFGAFAVAPAGTPWSYAGTAGVAGNASGFTGGNPAAPEGTQVAYLQMAGRLSQSLTLAAGTYAVSFQAAQRGNWQASAQTFRVLVDGVSVGTFTPSGVAYAASATAAFTVAAGAHTLAFEGLNPNGGDNTAFLDAVSVAPAAPPAAVQGGGFESPAVGTGTFGAFAVAPAGTPWAYAGTAGVAGNASGFTGGNPAAPEGTQVAYLQMAGRLSQSLTLAAGTYAVSFQAAQRGNWQPGGPQTVRVLVDGAAVGTFTPAGTAYAGYTATFAVAAGPHTLAFEGLNPNGGDSTAFLDAVSVAPAAPPAAVQGGGFESPNVGTGTFGAFAVAPAGTPWAYAGTAGVAGNASGFTGGNPAAPEGTQVAYLQGLGGFSQSLTLAAGTYAVTFQAAQRGNWQASAQTFRVLVDGTPVGTFTPAGTAYAGHATAAFTVAAGAHTLTFEGLNPNGGDNTTFIDAVSIAAP